MQVSKREAGGQLGGLFIADSRDPALDMIYYARKGSVVRRDDTNLLLMADGEIHRKTVSDGQVSIIRFSSYAFDLSEFSAGGSGVSLLPKDQTTNYLWSPDPNDVIFQKSPLLYSTELHRRLSEWLYPIAFAMIAIGACGTARSHRQTAVITMLNAVGAAFILRWVGIFGEDAAEGSRHAAIWIYLVPLAGIVIPVWLASRNITIEWPSSVRKWAAASQSRVGDFLLAVRIRLSGFRRPAEGDAA